jgi:hypothetical protein
MNEYPRPQTYHSHNRTRSITRRALQLTGLTLAAFAFGGCAPLAPPQPTAATPPSAQTQCVGKLEPPYGLTVISDPALLAKTIQPAGKGGLCMGEVFQVTQPLTVYRVWDSSKPWSQFGKWWSFNPPAGPRDAYRIDNEICPAWSKLDQVTQCRLKVGSEIVIGPGQSAQCDATDNNVSYPPSAAIQVYVPNDNSDPSKELVSNCVAATAWP